MHVFMHVCIIVGGHVCAIVLREYLLLLQPIVAEARAHSAAGAPSALSANSR